MYVCTYICCEQPEQHTYIGIRDTQKTSIASFTNGNATMDGDAVLSSGAPPDVSERIRTLSMANIIHLVNI